jgi:hypothetical protein
MLICPCEHCQADIGVQSLPPPAVLVCPHCGKSSTVRLESTTHPPSAASELSPTAEREAARARRAVRFSRLTAHRSPGGGSHRFKQAMRGATVAWIVAIPISFMIYLEYQSAAYVFPFGMPKRLFFLRCAAWCSTIYAIIVLTLAILYYSTRSTRSVRPKLRRRGKGTSPGA